MQYISAMLILATTIALGSSAAWAQDSAASPAAKEAPKVVKVKEDLPNFHQVYPYLYRSGEPTEAGLKKLKSMGVKTLIDLRAPSERAFDEEKEAKALGLNYIMLTMTSAPPTEKQVETMLNTIKEAKADTSKGSVLVHCAHGSDRTGCMLGIWRVTQDNWTYEDAYKEMRKYWFTPKFTRLADAVKERAKNSDPKAELNKTETHSKTTSASESSTSSSH